jgi:hypothetical protein
MPSERQPKSTTCPATVTIPELEQSKTAVLYTLASQHSRRSYKYAIDRFIDWYYSEARLTFNRAVVVRYRSSLERLSLSAATINLHLSAIRRLADESAESGWLSPELAIGIRRVKGVKRPTVKYWHGRARTRFRRAWMPRSRPAGRSPTHERHIIWGRGCRSRGPLRRIVGWVNRYDRQRLTRKSVPESDWMAGTIGSAEYEFASLQGYRLGFIAGFDRETGHHPGCRLRRRQNREQVGCNRHSRQGLWHRSFDGERGYGHANEQAMDRYCRR